MIWWCRFFLLASGYPRFFYYYLGLSVNGWLDMVFAVCLPEPLSEIFAFLVGAVWGVVLVRNQDRFTRFPWTS